MDYPKIFLHLPQLIKIGNMKKSLLLLAVVLGMLPTAFAQSKENVARECVLVEVFTGIRCPYCPPAARGIAQMMEEGLAITLMRPKRVPAIMASQVIRP